MEPLLSIRQSKSEIQLAVHYRKVDYKQWYVYSCDLDLWPLGLQVALPVTCETKTIWANFEFITTVRFRVENQ